MGAPCLRTTIDSAIIRLRLSLCTDSATGGLDLRESLIVALAAYADGPLRADARRFLQGLSFDELQFIAEFLGACMIEAPQSDRHIVDFPAAARQDARARADQDHKMILLLEYLCRSESCARSAAPLPAAGFGLESTARSTRLPGARA